MAEQGQSDDMAISTAGEGELSPRPILNLFGVKARDYKRGGDPKLIPGLTLDFEYDGHIAPVKETDSFKVIQNAQEVIISRDLEAERKFRKEIRQKAKGFADPGSLIDEVGFGFPPERCLVLWPFDQMKALEKRGGGFYAAVLLQRIVPDLQAKGWQVKINSSWPFQVHEPNHRVFARIEEEGASIVTIEANVEVSGVELPLRPILEQLIKQLPEDGLSESFDLSGFLSGRKMLVAVRDGEYAALPVDPMIPYLRIFSEIGEKQSIEEAGKILAIRESLEKQGASFQGGEKLLRLGEFLARLQNGVTKLSPGKGFAGTLRDYQSIGSSWLGGLYESGYGGILADDMGLGKTVQAIAHLSRIHEDGKAESPSLLIVTASMLLTWNNEIKRFAPHLRVKIYYGHNRYLNAKKVNDYDVILTTYGVLRHEFHFLSKIAFSVILADEVQNSKNSSGKTAIMLRRVKGRQRVGLSGTPIENHLGELWSLMDWVNPGLLGARKVFDAQVRRLIEKEHDAAALDLLRKRISPFLLRRTKEEVASELPEKTITTEIIPMSEEQKRVYESLRMLVDADIRNVLKEKGLQHSKINILSAMMKLRQACCDPRLVKSATAASMARSSKLDFLMDKLEELVEEGRRVLVFSQFVQMLTLIETEIQKRGWSYEMLTGKTQDRQDRVDRFQSGKSSVFLLSLKAGGVGLTLTEADTVILYDPWWNPAAERQAMDRAHRIGQQKPVFVYRLIMQGSIEARIQDIQSEKQSLTDALLDGETQGIANLSEGEILSLFAPIED